MVIAVFSMTIFKRPSRMAGVRCSMRLRSHSYSCNPMDSFFQSTLDASGATASSPNKLQQAAPIEIGNAHTFRRPAIGGEIESKKRLRDPHQGYSDRNVDIGNRCKGSERQQPVPEIL